MSRTSRDEYCKETGRLLHGYDYENQAWVIEGKYVRCGHPKKMSCRCYGKAHKGEETKGRGGDPLKLKSDLTACVACTYHEACAYIEGRCIGASAAVIDRGKPCMAFFGEETKGERV